MLLTALFVFTATVTILNLFRLVSIIADNGIVYPGDGIARPTHWIWMYSSALYQMWFWVEYAEIIPT